MSRPATKTRKHEEGPRKHENTKKTSHENRATKTRKHEKESIRHEGRPRKHENTKKIKFCAYVRYDAMLRTKVEDTCPHQPVPVRRPLAHGHPGPVSRFRVRGPHGSVKSARLFGSIRGSSTKRERHSAHRASERRWKWPLIWSASGRRLRRARGHCVV